MINPTIMRITLRGLMRRRRCLLLLPLPALVAGLALLAELLGRTPPDGVPAPLVGPGFPQEPPVVAMSVVASATGSDVEDGPLGHILAKPLPRRAIILSKLVVAVAVTALACGAGMVAAGVLAGSGRLALGLFAGTAVGAVAYSALFLALSAVSRRPVLAGLLYVLIWEGMLSNLMPGVRLVSIQHYAVSVAQSVAGTDLFNGTVSVPVTLVMTALITVAATVLAVDRLRSFALAGETS